MNTNLANLPTGLKLERWFTNEDELPSESTDDIFLVRAVDVRTKEIIHSLAMFVYDPYRKPVDYDEWRFICGASCYARYSSDNIYNVIAWTKLKLV